MKNILLVLIIFSLTAFQQIKEKEVYVCKSVASKRYHLKKNCKGLTSCKTEIKKTTKKKAKRYGRTLCKWERKLLKKKINYNSVEN